jgi:hypothetical protein
LKYISTEVITRERVLEKIFTNVNFLISFIPFSMERIIVFKEYKKTENPRRIKR